MSRQKVALNYTIRWRLIVELSRAREQYSFPSELTWFCQDLFKWLFVSWVHNTIETIYHIQFYELIQKINEIHRMHCPTIEYYPIYRDSEMDKELDMVEI